MWLGGLVQLVWRRYDGLIALYERHGPVFSIGPYVYLIGPEANRFLFANAHLFRWREAFESLAPVDGETALILSDGADHKRRRRLVQPAFHYRRIETYLTVIADSADATLDTWRAGQEVDVYQEFRTAIRRGNIHALFGHRLASDAELFGENLQLMLEMIDRLPPSLRLRQRLGTPAWRRAMAAKNRADERIYAEIARLRRTPAEEHGDEHDVLATLIRGRDDDGDGLTDVEARDQAISLIAAGYETTSAAMAWAVHALLTTDGAWDRVRAEVDGVPTPDLTRLTYLGGVVQETLRLYPPAAISVRKPAEDFDFAGHRVRAGDTVIYSPYATHRLPQVWPDPLRFAPERWDPASAGYRKPAAHEFLPFGGGPHRCIGATLATTELTVMLARLTARASLTLTTRRVRPTGVTAMRPRDGVKARVEALRPG
jgi:cytochrome P450